MLNCSSPSCSPISHSAFLPGQLLPARLYSWTPELQTGPAGYCSGCNLHFHFLIHERLIAALIVKFSCEPQKLFLGFCWVHQWEQRGAISPALWKHSVLSAALRFLFVTLDSRWEKTCSAFLGSGVRNHFIFYWNAQVYACSAFCYSGCLESIKKDENTGSLSAAWNDGNQHEMETWSQHGVVEESLMSGMFQQQLPLTAATCLLPRVTSLTLV